MTRPHASVDWIFVLALSALQLLTWGTVFYGFSVFLEPIEQQLALPRAQATLGFSLALLAEGLAAYPLGRWIDQGYGRRVMGLGSAVVGLGFLGLAQVESLLGFLLAWGVMGLGLAATLYPAAFAVLTRRYPDQFRRPIIVLTFLGGLASTVCIPLCAWMVSHWGWRDTALYLGLLHLVLCAPAHAWLLRDERHIKARHTGPQVLEPLGPHARNPTFWFLGIFIVVLMGVTAALPAHLVSLLRGHRLEEFWVLMIPAWVGVVQVVGRFGLLVTERRIDPHVTNRWIPGLIPVGLLALWWDPHGVGLWAFVLLYGAGNGMLTIVKGTVVAQYITPNLVGSLYGLLGVPLALARAAAPWLLGVLWNPETGYDEGLIWLAALAIGGWLSLWGAQARARGTDTG